MRAIGVVVFLAALNCLPSVAQILPTDSPSAAYRALSCKQLAQEGRALSKRGFVASGLLAGQGGSDATLTAAATVLIWPETPREQRSVALALADNQMAALEQASVESQCSIRFQQPPKS
jgi:hypothetical protein